MTADNHFCFEDSLPPTHAASIFPEGTVGVFPRQGELIGILHLLRNNVEIEISYRDSINNTINTNIN